MKRSPALRVGSMLVCDAICIVLAMAASIELRFGSDAQVWACLTGNLPLLFLSLAVRLSIYARFGLYHRLWRYAGTRELRSAIAAGVLCGALFFVGDLYVLPALGLPHHHSRTVLLLDAILNLGYLTGSRLLLRMVQEYRLGRRRRAAAVSPLQTRRALVVGAGDAAAMVVREMLLNPALAMLPVGLVDDDPAKRRMCIHGVPVLGSVEDIPALAAQHRLDEAIIALPNAPGSAMRRIKRICHSTGLSFRTIPSVHEILDGKVSLKQLREVRVEDLLRREPVVTDQTGVRAYVRGARVMVTGAGGSIGSEICRQLARHEPSQVLLLGHGEFSIFNIERELRKRFPWLPAQPLIADVRDAARIDQLVDAYRPDVIFHAAAHKHVPLMEANVEEAVMNNVLGTQSVLRAAAAHGVQRFVLISTDKAVRPTSVMGTTKRVAELLVQETAARTGRPYVAVRFGNVLGSRGSAVPIFQEQIAAGGPVTVTHPEMRRYFMTIPEAVQLVLHAAALGQGGEVFVLDMGEPVRVVDLATDLIELAGLTPGEEIEIVYTGLRPGEKLYEELVLDDEQHAPTAHPKIFVFRNRGKAAGSEGQLEGQIAELAGLAHRARTKDVVAGLRRLVPEFEPGLATPAGDANAARLAP